MATEKEIGDTLQYIHSIENDRRDGLARLLFSDEPATVNVTFTKKGGLIMIACEGEEFDVSRTVGGFVAHSPAGAAMRLALLLSVAPDRQNEILAKLQSVATGAADEAEAAAREEAARADETK
jgi:hypothetical protein